MYSSWSNFKNQVIKVTFKTNRKNICEASAENNQRIHLQTINIYVFWKYLIRFLYHQSTKLQVTLTTRE